MSACVVFDCANVSWLRADCEIGLCVCAHVFFPFRYVHASDGPAAAPHDVMGISQFALNIKKTRCISSLRLLAAGSTYKRKPCAYPPLTLCLKLMRAHTHIQTLWSLRAETKSMSAGAFQRHSLMEMSSFLAHSRKQNTDSSRGSPLFA